MGIYKRIREKTPYFEDGLGGVLSPRNGLARIARTNHLVHGDQLASFLSILSRAGQTLISGKASIYFAACLLLGDGERDEQRIGG